MSYEEAAFHSDNTDDVIHVRFSDDNGATWTAEDTDLNSDPVAGFPAYPTGGSPEDDYGPGGTYIWQASNGDIYLHCWLVDYDAPGIAGMWRTKSADNGITWGAWEQLSVTGQTEAENNRTEFEEVHFIYDGNVYAICRVYETDSGPVGGGGVKGIFIKSEDNGATWTKISDLGVYADGLHEFAAEYVGDNNIVVVIRDQGNAKTFYMTSDDMGVTWRSIIANITTTVNTIGRPRMYTDAHLKGQANWWTDPRIIMEGFVLTNPGVSTGRRNAIWLSEDSGYVWRGPFYLDDATEDAGYGDLTYDANTDTYRVVTYQGAQAEADLVQYDFSVNWTS